MIFSLSALFTPFAQASQHSPQMNGMHTIADNIGLENPLTTGDTCEECIGHSNTMTCLDRCVSMTTAILVDLPALKLALQPEPVHPHTELSRGLTPTVETFPPIDL
ncbi:hypothetical protein WH96_15440 [Kiloniella spongiae]|uniref:Uncharacterized protein n=1 Tax=Kiloniella spongiae TaxID=1489064 RepID=A0A0H2MSY7_9PROT|nr:hypothetical protein WH96_15440 [Kiloniella spongiae]